MKNIRKKFNQAVTKKLRKESGAAVTRKEYRQGVRAVVGGAAKKARTRIGNALIRRMPKKKR